jgi:hypothetical protein
MVAWADKTIADTVHKLNDITESILLDLKRHAETHQKLMTDNIDEDEELAQPYIIFNFQHL